MYPSFNLTYRARLFYIIERNRLVKLKINSPAGLKTMLNGCTAAPPTCMREYPCQFGNPLITSLPKFPSFVFTIVPDLR
jgi:hypothetical protein